MKQYILFLYLIFLYIPIYGQSTPNIINVRWNNETSFVDMMHLNKSTSINMDFSIDALSAASFVFNLEDYGVINTFEIINFINTDTYESITPASRSNESAVYILPPGNYRKTVDVDIKQNNHTVEFEIIFNVDNSDNSYVKEYLGNKVKSFNIKAQDSHSYNLVTSELIDPCCFQDDTIFYCFLSLNEKTHIKFENKFDKRNVTNICPSIFTIKNTGTAMEYILAYSSFYYSEVYPLETHTTDAITLNQGIYLLKNDIAADDVGIWVNIYAKSIDSGLPDPEIEDEQNYNVLDRNYIISRVYQDERGSSHLDQIQYYDGLGRPTQLRQLGITPQKGDLVTLQEYDVFGRKSRTWLPSASYSVAYTPIKTLKSEVVNFYNNDLRPYSQTVYEPSSLDRIIRQYGAGEDWFSRDRGVETNNLINNTGYYGCILYKAKGNSLSKDRNYTTGELYITQIKDENNNESYEFKNKLGQVILTRQINNYQKHDTYYVYDDFGNQCFVLPPRIQEEGIDQAKLDELAYQYRYDYRNRCIAKKLPGCDWIYYVYDKADQLIFTQDGEQRAKKEWLFSIPDAFGRPVMSGVCKDTLSIHSSVVRAEYTGSGIYKGYTVSIGGKEPSSFDVSNLLSVNYYDNYDFLNRGIILNSVDYLYDKAKENDDFGKRYDKGHGYEAKGLLTGTITSTFGNNAELYSVMYYDNRARLVQSRSINHLNGQEIEYFAYNFIGQPIKKLHSHRKDNGSNPLNELYTYTYDHSGRLLETKHKINDMPEIILSSMQYDELGRLKGKSLGISQ